MRVIYPLRPEIKSEDELSANSQRQPLIELHSDPTQTFVDIRDENPGAQPTGAAETIRWVCNIILFTLVAGVISTLILPLLLVGYLITRFIQLITTGQQCQNVALLKRAIYHLIFCCKVLLLIVALIMLAIIPFVPQLQHLIVLDLSITKWLVVYCKVFGISAASLCLGLIFSSFIPKVPLNYGESGQHVALGVTEITSCCLFWLAIHEVTESVLAFEDHKILGLNTHKWIKAFLFVIIAYNIIALITHTIVWLLRKTFSEGNNRNKSPDRAPLPILDLEKTKYFSVYFASGMRHSTNFVFSSVLLLVVWMVYFKSHLDQTILAQKVLKFGTYTFCCLLVCSVLWLIKAWVILSWEAFSIYGKWKTQILEVGKEFYFLSCISYNNSDVLRHIGQLNDANEYVYNEVWRYEKKSFKQLLMQRPPSMYTIKQIGLRHLFFPYDVFPPLFILPIITTREG